MVNVDFNIMDEERGGGVTGESYIHVDYGDSTWERNGCDYWPSPPPFHGPTKHFFSSKLMIFNHIFGLFWTHNTLRSIVMETDRYASGMVEGKDHTGGGGCYEGY